MRTDTPGSARSSSCETISENRHDRGNRYRRTILRVGSQRKPITSLRFGVGVGCKGDPSAGVPWASTTLVTRQESDQEIPHGRTPEVGAMGRDELRIGGKEQTHRGSKSMMSHSTVA